MKSPFLLLVASVFALSASSAAARPTAGHAPSKAKKPLPRRAQVEASGAKIPRDNHAYWLGSAGVIDTDIDLDDFAHGDFTITLWAQPEYQFGGNGAMLGENGSGRFFIGQGDYRKGPYDRKKQEPESPMFRVAFGGKEAFYKWPEVVANAWVHIAVVRSGNRITVYMNGVPRKRYRSDSKTPRTFDVNPSDSKAPHGTLRIGRRSTGRKGQFYGFVDDIGIFRVALAAAHVEQRAAKKRLDGKDAVLWRGIGFDKPGSAPLPLRLRTELKPRSRARQYKVSRTRRKSDRAVWGSPFHLAAAYKVPIQLPFPKNEVWRVTQGINDPGPSHNGGSAFASMDFSRVDGKCGAIIYAPTAGDVVNYRRDHDPAGSDREGNFVHLWRDRGLGFTMMHFETEGLVSRIKGGEPREEEKYKNWNTFPAADGPTFAAGDEIGTLGANACHLHMGAWRSPFGERNPYPFADFEVSEDKGKTWRFIARGIPRTGMWVRRTVDVPVTPRPITRKALKRGSTRAKKRRGLRRR